MIEYLKEFDEYIIKEERSIAKQVRFYRNKVEILNTWNRREVYITLYKDGRKMTFSIENPDRKKIKKRIEEAKKFFKFIPPSPFSISIDRNYSNKKIFDRNVVDEEKILDTANQVINSSTGEVAGSLYSRIENIRLINSKGIDESDKNSMFYISCRMLKNDCSAHYTFCSRKIGKIDEKEIDEEKEYINKKMKFKKVKEGKYKILFSPLAFSNLSSNFADFSSAFFVKSGYSFLDGKMGKKVASENISIYDSGIEKDGLFSRKFDDEGVATRKTVIVERGILKNYLYNSVTAKEYGKNTTGNAGIVVPVPWNTIIDKGDCKKEEMMEELNGIFITNIWYTRFKNYRTGDFSTVARDMAFFVKNGEILYPLKGIRISDKIDRIFKNIEKISKERKQIYWWETSHPVFSPFVTVKNVSVTTGL
ncbi:MAG: TldD/PmbA family protein [Thermoplasmatales archaeon]|nr:TldD/PmbA family protein [Thermoplasmatales archaeon]